MSFYVAYVGEVIIKEEHRKGFGQLFHNKYTSDHCTVEIDDEVISDYIKKFGIDFLAFSKWKHCNNKEEWVGKYQTSYDEATGYFVYGVEYNIVTWGWDMDDFFHLLLHKIAENVIYEDSWSEC